MEDCRHCGGTKKLHFPVSGTIKDCFYCVHTEPQPQMKNNQKFSLSIYNGRIKVYADGYVMFTFNQIDFKGYYAYKDDTDLYGLDIYLMNEKGGARSPG